MMSYPDILKNNGVGVLPTDTIYGLVGRALSKKTVGRIYKLKGRNPSKPFIILIGSLSDLKLFNIRLDLKTKKILKKLWPGKVSVILPCPPKKFFYLHRGTKTLAFRFPQKASLIKILKKTGPLVAPSANLEGLPPAQTIAQAKGYFGERVEFYLDAGQVRAKASRLVYIKDGKIIVIRR